MRNGRACGARGAYSRPRGAAPKCYPGDITEAMITITAERPLVETISWKRLRGRKDIRLLAKVMPAAHRALGILINHRDDGPDVLGQLTLSGRFTTQGIERLSGAASGAGPYRIASPLPASEYLNAATVADGAAFSLFNAKTHALFAWKGL
jgi:hypothetical protein